MEQNTTFDEFDNSKKAIKRRRDLLPIWIKIFTWIFLIFGIISIIIPILGLFLEKVDLSLYGLSTTSAFSPIGIAIVLLFLFKGIVAYGLWFEKKWAVQFAIIDAIIGIVVSSYVMIIQPFIDGTRNFNIRLELVALIPYLMKMRKIQKQWEEMK